MSTVRMLTTNTFDLVIALFEAKDMQTCPVFKRANSLLPHNFEILAGQLGERYSLTLKRINGGHSP